MATPKSVIWQRDPHTAEKHKLLRAYLNAWWPVLFQGGYRGATYAEGFAGPGEYHGDRDGSPVIAVRSLLDQTDALPPHTARFMLIDDDPRRLKHLRKRLADRCPDLPRSATVDIREGECATTLLPALDENQAWGEPVFAFLDPFNTAAPYEIVKRIAQNRSSEVLVTFMSDQLQRWARKEDPQQGDLMFGDGEWRHVAEQPSTEKPRWLINLYRQRLKQAGFDYRLAFELVDEGGHAFFLVHGTKSEAGLRKMKDAMWRVDPERGVRFRDPHDTRQLTFDIRPEPELGALGSMLADHLEQQQEPVGVADLREWALTETVFLEKHVPAVLREWRDRYRDDPVVELDPSGGQISRHTTVRLLRRPPQGRARTDRLFDLSPSD